MGNNQKKIGLTRVKKLLIFIVLLLFIIVGFIFIENPLYSTIYGFIYKETKINFKSDAEIISQFQAHKEELDRLIEKEAQSGKEYDALRLEINKKNEPLNNQLKNNEDINKNNQQLKSQEHLRLLAEKSQNDKVLSDFIKVKSEETKKFLESIGFSELSNCSADYTSLEAKKWMCGKKFGYQEEQNQNKYKMDYSIEKGLMWFGENNQPDRQYVVDNLDKFHDTGNIKWSAQKFKKTFGKDCETIFLHLGGNWYLFLYVRVAEKYPDPIDGYNY